MRRLAAGAGRGQGVTLFNPLPYPRREPVALALPPGMAPAGADGTPIVTERCGPAALAVLDVMEREKLANNALEIGGYMMDRFEELKQKHEVLGDVRGRGLVMGLEFVEDKQSREPAADLTLEVMLKAARHGLLLGRVGLHGNVVRIAPPLVVSEEEAGAGIDIIDKVLSAL